MRYTISLSLLAVNSLARFSSGAASTRRAEARQWRAAARRRRAEGVKGESAQAPQVSAAKPPTQARARAQPAASALPLRGKGSCPVDLARSARAKGQPGWPESGAGVRQRSSRRGELQGAQRLGCRAPPPTPAGKARFYPRRAPFARSGMDEGFAFPLDWAGRARCPPRPAFPQTRLASAQEANLTLG